MPPVIVYSKPACVQCTATTRALDSAGIPYEKIDVSQDAAALQRILDRGFMAAPVVEVGDDSWSGFQPDKIKELAARYPGAAA